MSDHQEDPVSDLEASVTKAKQFYSSKLYRDCIQVLEKSLSDAATQGPIILAELHLLLAKCYRGLDELKNAILSCNSAIEHRPHWKDPYLYRSVCFQAFHSKLLETDGEDEANVERDRSEAEVIVGGQPIDGSDKKFVTRIDEALSVAKNGDKIFIEAGVYDVTSLFLFDKTVCLIGASVKRCVLRYKRCSDGTGTKESRLETFMICSGNVPTLIKRLTFQTSNPADVKTKFFGVAGGTVQLEDCLFDGGDDEAEVGVVYMNAKICGPMASNFQSPRVISRFCVFDRCSSFGAFSALHSCGSLHNCFFVNCGKSCVNASDSAKVSVFNCEFALSEFSEIGVGATSSDLTVSGCYFYGATSSPPTRSSYAVGITLKSVAKVTRNYFHLTGNGVSCVDSDLTCSQNLVISCSQKFSASLNSPSTLGLFSGITLRQKSRISLNDNKFSRCDVAVYVGDGAIPIVKENTISSSFFAGIFVEKSSKPNIVANSLDGGSKEVAAGLPVCGLGILHLAESGGLVGKNTFSNFCVSPLMVFSSCHPLVRDNEYDAIEVDEEKQKVLEKSMLEQFQAELFRSDQYFYIVDSACNERELQDVILKGPAEKSDEN